MKRYRLKKDLPTFKAGELFFINNYGQLVSNENKSIVAYSAATLKKFPNILEEWFEEIKPGGPLIKDEKIRKAVRAWAEAIGENQVQVTHCRKRILSIWGLSKENSNIDFDCYIEPFDEGFYTIAKLCGEEEE